MLTDQFLLKGAGLSLKNAENLVNASVTLVNNGFFPQSIVLASFAQEQLGQFRILEEIYHDPKLKQSMTLSELKKKLEDHVFKQTRGLSGISITYPSNSQQAIIDNNWHKAIRERNFDRIKELEKSRQELFNRRRKRLPQDRYDLRMKSLYVDIDQSGDGWISPQVGSIDAFNFVAGVCGDYEVIVQYKMKELKNSANKTAKFLNKIIKTTGIGFEHPNWPS